MTLEDIKQGLDKLGISYTEVPFDSNTTDLKLDKVFSVRFYHIDGKARMISNDLGRERASTSVRDLEEIISLASYVILK